MPTHILRAAAAVLIGSTPVFAQASEIPPVEEQIAAAVLPLPEDLRDGAAIMGYKTKDKLEILQQGTNNMICLALYVSRPDFHVACYHKALEPFMARGRQLRAEGVAAEKVDEVRFKDIADGKLKMPQRGALYSITTKKESWDPVTRKLSGGTKLAVVYIPFATTEETGLSAKPQANGPWIMFPGTAKAHIMVVGEM